MKVATTLIAGCVIWIVTAAVVYLWPGLIERINAELFRQMLVKK